MAQLLATIGCLISVLRPVQWEQSWSEPSAVPTTNPAGKSVACGVSAHNLASHSGSLQEEAAEKPLQAGKHHLSQLMQVVPCKHPTMGIE